MHTCPEVQPEVGCLRDIAHESVSLMSVLACA